MMCRQLIPFFTFFILAACSRGTDKNLIEVNADSRKGFNFPYLLYVPETLSDNKEVLVIVEPNNSGFANDKLRKHLEKARRTASIDFYTGNYVSRKLGYPLLVPVFPRPESEWKIYTHALDRDAVLQKGNPLERLDLQLVRMIEHARDTLQKLGYPTGERVLMTGFSASGTFVNRFSLIHPDRVFALAAGGLNGLLMLPVREMNGQKVNYPLGTNDFSDLFGMTFDSAAFKNIPQFLYMGKLDDNDAVLFDDGYDPDERETVFRTTGEKMQPDRWNSCRDIYLAENINATIISYDSLGHENPLRVKEDILSFFISVIDTSHSSGLTNAR